MTAPADPTATTGTALTDALTAAGVTVLGVREGHRDRALDMVDVEHLRRSAAEVPVLPACDVIRITVPAGQARLLCDLTGQRWIRTTHRPYPWTTSLDRLWERWFVRDVDTFTVGPGGLTRGRVVELEVPLTRVRVLTEIVVSR